jgi:hypothetical protein
MVAMTRVDTFGKYFTEVVSKTPLRVIIQCLDTRIHGTIHLNPANRLSDEINESELFLPVTDARVIRADEKIEVGFISVNKHNILWIVPAEDLEEAGDD